MEVYSKKNAVMSAGYIASVSITQRGQFLLSGEAYRLLSMCKSVQLLHDGASWYIRPTDSENDIRVRKHERLIYFMSGVLRDKIFNRIGYAGCYTVKIRVELFTLEGYGEVLKLDLTSGRILSR